MAARKILRKDSKGYQKYLEHFKKQFSNISRLTKMYVDADNKVYAGEWIDGKGTYHFTSGFAPDVKYIVYVK